MKIVCPWIGCLHNLTEAPKGFDMPKYGICNCKDDIVFVETDECSKCDPGLVCKNFYDGNDE